MPLSIDERASGVANVYSRIGLDEIFVINNAYSAAANGADDSHGDRLPQAKRVADREHNVAGTRFIAVGKCDRGQILLVDLKQRHVRARIGTDFLGLVFAELDAAANPYFIRP